MAPTRRKGLQVPLKSPSPKPPKKSNADRCREYRAALKADPEKYAAFLIKSQARNVLNRQRTLTEEEKARRRELNKLRQQECRARKKAALPECAEKTQASAAKPRRSRAKIKKEGQAPDPEHKRQKWAEAKKKERQKWTEQRKCIEREKALQRYYQKKAQHTSSSPVPAGSTPKCGPPKKPVQIREKGDTKQLFQVMKDVQKQSPKEFERLMKRLLLLGKTSPRKKPVQNNVDEGSSKSKTVKKWVTCKLKDSKKEKSPRKPEQSQTS